MNHQHPLRAVNSKVKQQALWFIQAEKTRVLENFENGTIDRQQTIGSLNTLYQIASHTKDVEGMRNLWQMITALRTANAAIPRRISFPDQSIMG